MTKKSNGNIFRKILKYFSKEAILERMKKRAERKERRKTRPNESKIMEIIYIIFIIFAVISIFLIIGKVQVLTIYIGAVLLALEASYIILSFGTVEVDERAARFIFDKPIDNLEPGLYFAPLGIVSVKKELGTIFQDELPAGPEKIFREDDKEKVPEGMFLPIRIKFGGPPPDSRDSINIKLKDDPYHVPMVTEVVPVVCWHISDAIIFFRKMGTIENCRKILQDKAIEVFGNTFAKMTPAMASLKLEKISKALQTKLETEIGGKRAGESWGITINNAYVKPFIFTHKLNESVIDASIAKQKAKATVTNSVAEKEKRINEGTGTADAEKLLLEARAIGTGKLAEICKTPEGQITLWMDTMAKAFEKADYSIIPGSELFSSVAGMKEMFDKIKGGVK